MTKNTTTEYHVEYFNHEGKEWIAAKDGEDAISQVQSKARGGTIPLCAEGYRVIDCR